MSVAAPPRPPKAPPPPDHDPFAALIEEARVRARRRRLRNIMLVGLGIAMTLLVALAGAVILDGDRPEAGATASDAGLPATLRDAQILVTGYPELGMETVRRWTSGGVEELELGGPVVGWSPDGTRLLVVHGYGLDDLEVVGTDGTKVASAPRAHLGDGTGETAVWSPDGSKVAYAAPPGFSTMGTERYRRLFVMDADGANARRLPYFVLGGPPFGGNISWAPDGGRIAFAGRKLSDDDLRLADHVRTHVERSIFVLRPGGDEPASRLPLDIENPSQPTWSPDGKLIAFTGPGAPGEGSSVYVMRADGSGVRMIARGGSHPLWSPNGARLAYRAGERTWTVRADGRARAVLPASAHGVSWSPDGSMLVYVAEGGFAGTGSDVFVVRADGTDRLRILHSDTLAYRYPVWRGGTSTLGGD